MDVLTTEAPANIADKIGYPNSDLRISRLRKAMDWSAKQLKPFRQHRFERLQAYVGHHYTDTGSPRKMPVNIMELAAGIYTRKLTPAELKYLVSTFHRGLKSQAYEFELAINHLVQEIDLSTTIARCVSEAIFGMGIVKVGLCLRPDFSNNQNNVGQPFADCVSFDDWIQDMNARRYEECAFAGNRYRLPYEYLLESGEFQNVDKLSPTVRNTESRDRAIEGSSLSKEQVGGDDDFEDYVELWDIWLPRQRLVVTIPFDGSSGDEVVLKTVEWEGPELGPFDTLHYQEVPSNSLPLPPAAQWQDLNELENRLFRKLANQAERQKSLLAFQATAHDDAKRITEASDGDAVKVDDLQAIMPMSTGGIDQSNFAFAVAVKDWAVYLAGNLDALGGLSPQAETLGQEQLLSESANERLADMREKTMKFVTRVGKSLAHWLWYDPFIELPLVKRIPGTDYEKPFDWGPDRREGDFMAYNLSIEPYGAIRQTPAQRLSTVRQAWQELMLPAAPLMAQQGIGLDFEGLIKLYAKYANVPELLDTILFMEGEMNPSRGPVDPAGSGMAKPASTTRNYVRTNRPGATRQGADQTLVNTLMGGNPQASERAAIGRPKV